MYLENFVDKRTSVHPGHVRVGGGGGIDFGEEKHQTYWLFHLLILTARARVCVCV